MKEKRGSGYIFGILSIVFAFFVPLAGVILGIIGLVLNKKEKSRKAKIMNILGIIFGILVLALGILATVLSIQGSTFPIY